MSERDKLLRYILNNPAEDAARLVYADKLDESGKPWDAARAEFIRLQIRRVGEFEPNISARDRQQALLKKWGAKWLPALARFDAGACSRGNFRYSFGTSYGETITLTDEPGGVTGEYTFSRGFLSAIRMTGPERPAPQSCANFARQCLAANPLELIVFVRRNYKPEVSFRVRQLLSGHWYATLDAEKAGAATHDHQERRILCSELAPFFLREIPQIQFEWVIPF